MTPKGLTVLGKYIFLACMIASCQKENFSVTKQPDPQSDVILAGKSSGPAKVTVFATGLKNPRGLHFGPDGYLYVAEGGAGGTSSTTGQCAQVIPPVGPYLGSPTGGRISKINRKGVRTTLVENLPSTINSLGDVSGVSDVVFVGNDLYALVTGGGCSHGVSTVPNGIYRINKNGTHTMIANLSEWSLNHPVASPEEDDYEPDGDWYSFVYAKGSFFAVEANHGEIVRVKMNGNISRLVDVSATFGHIVPTALAFDDNFYVGNLNPFPIIDGSSSVYKVTGAGKISKAFTGFTTILGLVIDEHDNMYVLQSSTGHPFPTPDFGSVIKIDRKGNKETIATGLSLPTGITIGPDGNLYISNVGYGPASVGGGQVVEITLKHNDDYDHHEDHGHDHDD